jgi:gamma-glutamylcyclotransferase (GGCT)/AIG2-like uncharacterized protein YtfP
MPGHLRWPTIRSAVIAARPAQIAGELYDTGAGYPAARLVPCGDQAPGDRRATVVAGWILEIHEDRSEQLLVVLDRIEGNQYERVDIVTIAGDRGIAYGWSGGVTGLRPLPEGWTLTHEQG